MHDGAVNRVIEGKRRGVGDTRAARNQPEDGEESPDLEATSHRRELTFSTTRFLINER
jgi:hypothetical protein